MYIEEQKHWDSGLSFVVVLFVIIWFLHHQKFLSKLFFSLGSTIPCYDSRRVLFSRLIPFSLPVYTSSPLVGGDGYTFYLSTLEDPTHWSQWVETRGRSSSPLLSDSRFFILDFREDSLIKFWPPPFLTVLSSVDSEFLTRSLKSRSSKIGVHSLSLLWIRVSPSFIF